MNSLSTQPTEPENTVTQAEADYWDRALDWITRTAALAAALVVAAGLAGAWFGWLEWNLRLFAPVSTLALIAAGAGLAWLLKLLFRRERSLPVVFLGVGLAAALVLGFEGARYLAFRSQTGREITERLTADLRDVFPVQVPGLIDQFLERRTGQTGVSGYVLLFTRLQGNSFLVLAGARASLCLAAVVAVLRAGRRRKRRVHPMGWGEKT